MSAQPMPPAGTAEVLEAIAADTSIPGKVRSRRLILQAVLDAAKANRGRVTAATIRDALRAVDVDPRSLHPHQFGAVTSSLRARGWLTDTGFREKSGNNASRNAEREMTVYRLNGPYIVTPDGQMPPKYTDTTALASWEAGVEEARPAAPAPLPRPPFPYFGGKQRIAAQIVSLLPPHEHYVEPFCGSLAVLAAKEPSKMETVNDLDGEIMGFWRVLRERPEELVLACALTPHGRAELKNAREDRDAPDDVERARRVWVRLTQGRGGLLGRNGWRHFITPSGSSINLPKYLDAYVDRMGAMADRLHDVSLECRPALDVIAAYGRDPNMLLYLDPPYLGATRAEGTRYQHEMRQELDHEELLTAIQDLPAAVLISGYHSTLYDTALAGWDSVEIKATTQQGNGHGATSFARTEVVWSNRPLYSTDVFPLFQQALA